MVGLLLLPSLAHAHPARASAVVLDIGPWAVRATFELPRDQLVMALNGSPTAEGALPGDEEVGQYVLSHFELRDARGTLLPERLESVAWQVRDGLPTLVLAAHLDAPPGADLHALTLKDTAILDVVVSHKIYVSVRQDAPMGQLGESRLVDTVKYGQPTLRIDRPGASALRAIGAALRMGAAHIGEGVDHLLFLLCLLLVAPVRALGGRWVPMGDLRGTLRRILGITAAFTAGHSLTLALAALDFLRPPTAPVEAAIAASIAVTAIHAARPLFPGREVWVAGGFGLVHGLAFATALAGLGFDPRGLVVTLLGFNLGVELAQLGAILATLPALLLMSGGPLAAPGRWALSSVTLLAACGWLAERAVGAPNPLAPALERAVAHPALLLGALTAAALTSRLPARLPGPRARSAGTPT